MLIDSWVIGVKVTLMHVKLSYKYVNNRVISMSMIELCMLSYVNRGQKTRFKGRKTRFIEGIKLWPCYKSWCYDDVDKSCYYDDVDKWCILKKWVINMSIKVVVMMMSMNDAYSKSWF